MSLLILFFHPPSTTEIYTLSLHDALPIFITRSDFIDEDIVNNEIVKVVRNKTQSNRQLQEQDLHERAAEKRSEEHTSELQSRGHLVCRLLLEKKKKKHIK